jgi:6-phosphofructokinase 1
VVAEGAKLSSSSGHQLESRLDEFGHVRLGGIGNVVAVEIERRTGYEARSVVLGHIQRGGSPTAFDRMLATRYGIGAIDMVHRREFGYMVALQGTEIVSVPLQKALQRTRVVPPELLEVANSLQDRRGSKETILA